MKKRLPGHIAAILAGALLLSGCGGTTGLAALDRPATAEDTLPGHVTIPPEVEPESVRLLVEDGRFQYYGSQDADRRLGCFLIVATDKAEDQVTSCVEMKAQPFNVAVAAPVAGISASFVADGFNTAQLESEGWTKIHDNVLVQR